MCVCDLFFDLIHILSEVWAAYEKKKSDGRTTIAYFKIRMRSHTVKRERVWKTTQNVERESDEFSVAVKMFTTSKHNNKKTEKIAKIGA